MSDRQEENKCKIRFCPAGDAGLMVKFEEKIDEDINDRVMTLAGHFREAALPGVLDLIPAFCTLLICYDPGIMDADFLQKKTMEFTQDFGKEKERETRIVEIPVCYGRYFGPDLKTVAGHAKLSEEEVIRLHSGRDYRIYMLGFLPGFPYLGGMSEVLSTPRLATPRTKIPAGSVGIGGSQTGIYPIDSPGGWQLIGRTPVPLFSPEEEHPFLYAAGDSIRFVPIDPEEYYEIRRRILAKTWTPEVLIQREERKE